MSEVPTRWEIELEFIQSLSNLQYLNYLAQNKYFDDTNFLSYLNYLEYWRSPEYSKFLIYPNCLHVLTLLKSQEFRQLIVRQDMVGVLMNDMTERWKDINV